MPVWVIPSGMSTANSILHNELTGEAEDPAAIEALAQKNAPAIIFGDILRLLGMTFLIITVIDISLKAFHIY